jgi:hypothetical protein
MTGTLPQTRFDRLAPHATLLIFDFITSLRPARLKGATRNP